MILDAIDQPLEVTAYKGEVVVLGPDGFSGSFTPQAASLSAKRLAAAAAEAAAQPPGGAETDPP